MYKPLQIPGGGGDSAYEIAWDHALSLLQTKNNNNAWSQVTYERGRLPFEL